MLQFIISALLVGFFGGLFSGFFGIGGASVTIPLLRIFLGVPGHTALGTSLLLVVPTAATGAYVFYRRGLLKLKTIALCGVSGIAFSLIGATLTLGVSGSILMLLTAGVLLLFSALLAIDREKGIYGLEGPQSTFQKASRSVFIGAVAGFSSGFLGIGGGVILIPLLVFLRKIPLHKSIAASLGIITIYAIPGSLAHFAFGHVDATLFLILVCGQVAGAYIGAKNASQMRAEDLKRLSAAFLGALGVLLAAFELLAAG